MKKEFLWGGATSNVQAEGGYLEDGKGLNVYDTLKIHRSLAFRSCIVILK